jgi:hypothetical protein
MKQKIGILKQFPRELISLSAVMDILRKKAEIYCAPQNVNKTLYFYFQSPRGRHDIYV